MTPLLEADKVSKRYGDFQALHEVSFAVNRGEIISLIGPNGAGKTSLVNLLTGFFPPSGGNVRVDGRSIAGRHHATLALAGVARSFQLITTFPTLTVEETLRLAINSREGRAYAFFERAGAARKTTARVAEIAEVFRLAHRLPTPCNLLSQGEKKLLDVATTFALLPSLIILDEPTSGVASADKHEIMRTLLAAAKQQGVASLLIVEHDMDLVRSYSTRILGLKEGVLVVDMPTDAFFKSRSALEALVGELGEAVAAHA